MVDTIIKVLEPATSIDLVSLDYIKAALGIDPSDTSQDELLANYITQYSDIIARECNRVTLAYEKVRETVRCLMPNRYYVSHWPIKEEDIESIESPRGTDYMAADYEVEEWSGKIELFAARDEPIVVTYSGGYKLPDEAPPGLQAAAEIMIRAARAIARMQATAGVRSISHREARVMFFDPNAALKVLSTPAAGAGQGVDSLLLPYKRFWV